MSDKLYAIAAVLVIAAIVASGFGSFAYVILATLLIYWPVTLLVVVSVLFAVGMWHSSKHNT